MLIPYLRHDLACDSKDQEKKREGFYALVRIKKRKLFYAPAVEHCILDLSPSNTSSRKKVLKTNVYIPKSILDIPMSTYIDTVII